MTTTTDTTAPATTRGARKLTLTHYVTKLTNTHGSRAVCHATDAEARDFIARHSAIATDGVTVGDQVVEVAQTYRVGDAVTVYAYGKRRPGTVTALHQAKVSVEFVKNVRGDRYERRFDATKIDPADYDELSAFDTPPAAAPAADAAEAAETVDAELVDRIGSIPAGSVVQVRPVASGQVEVYVSGAPFCTVPLARVRILVDYFRCTRPMCHGRQYVGAAEADTHERAMHAGRHTTERVDGPAPVEDANATLVRRVTAIGEVVPVGARVRVVEYPGRDGYHYRVTVPGGGVYHLDVDKVALDEQPADEQPADELTRSETHRAAIGLLDVIVTEAGQSLSRGEANAMIRAARNDRPGALHAVPIAQILDREHYDADEVMSRAVAILTAIRGARPEVARYLLTFGGTVPEADVDRPVDAPAARGAALYLTDAALVSRLQLIADDVRYFEPAERAQLLREAATRLRRQM